LPDLPRYFEKFADMQYRAVQAVAQSSRPALLEDYALLLKSSSISDLQSIPLPEFRIDFETIKA
jgi:hypothetical protein